MENLSTVVFLLVVVCFLEFADPGPQLREPFYDRDGSPLNDRREAEDRERGGILRTLLDNIAAVEDHNQLFEAGEALFRMRLNKFAYLEPVTFRRLWNGLRRLSESSRVPEELRNFLRRALAFAFPSGAVEVLGDVDWRMTTSDALVSNQQACASCWAFSTKAAVEGQIFKATGETVSLSAQNLIDCARRRYSSYGCNGGSMIGAYKYMEDVGIATTASYPYEARQGVCRDDVSLNVARLSGFVRIAEGNETQLMEAVSAVGPIAAGMDASLRTFQFYSSGVYYDPQCSSTFLDHSVLVVGYGTTATGVDYWVVKNSYGADWGEGGYFRLARNRENHCGIATCASYPILRV